MSAGPFPPKAMFQELDTRTRTTVLDPGRNVTVRPATNSATTTPQVSAVRLTAGSEDAWISGIGLDLLVQAADIQAITTFATPDGSGSPVSAAGSIQGVTHPSVPSLPGWSLIALESLLHLPAGGSLVVQLTGPVSGVARSTVDTGSSTPGAAVTLLDAQGAALGGVVYVAAYPPEQAQAGRVPRDGMRHVRTPTAALGAGSFEIVDPPGQTPYLRYISLDGVEVTWPGTVAAPPGGGS